MGIGEGIFPSLSDYGMMCLRSINVLSVDVYLNENQHENQFTETVHITAGVESEMPKASRKVGQ